MANDVGEAMREINRAWTQRRVDDLAPLVHDEIVMAAPGFAARSQGREAFLAGFRDFCENAELGDFREGPYEVDVIGPTAVVSYPYELDYAHGGARYRASGRDLWAFQLDGDRWVAVWRTMLDAKDEPQS